MQLSTLPRDDGSALRRGAGRMAATTSGLSGLDTLTDATKESQFATMAKAYGSSFGMASSHDAVRLLQAHCDQPISVLAHWIVEHKVVAFNWRAQTLLPLFQFQLSDMSLCEPIVQVVSELHEVLDDWDLALWFALPNHWLNQATPVASIEHDQPAVLQAARAERYVARW